MLVPYTREIGSHGNIRGVEKIENLSYPFLRCELGAKVEVRHKITSEILTKLQKAKKIKLTNSTVKCSADQMQRGKKIRLK